MPKQRESCAHKQARWARCLVVLTLALAMLASCATHKCTLCREPTTPGDVWTPPPLPGPSDKICGDDFGTDAAAKLKRTLDSEDGDANNDSVDIVLLSGGGSRGAFGVGVLDAWRAAGKQPEFDMVTGISTGAILATWVYLGSDEAYTIMRNAYDGGVTNSQIRRRRWLFPFVDSLYSLSPLLRLLKKRIPDEMILRVGDVYERTGRQLWIGTTNLETGQFCHWNLAERALKARNASGEERRQILDRYRRLIIASSANPTVFQAIEIDGNLHVDGGVSDVIFVEALRGIGDQVAESRERQKSGEAPIPLNVYGIVNGRLDNSEHCSKTNAISVAVRSISILSKSSARAHLWQIKGTVEAGMKDKPWSLYTGWLDHRVGADEADSFVPKEMHKLYVHGKEWYAKGRWCKGIPAPGHPDGLCRLPIPGAGPCAPDPAKASVPASRQLPPGRCFNCRGPR